jgi:hypothetical protein
MLKQSVVDIYERENPKLEIQVETMKQHVVQANITSL